MGRLDGRFPPPTDALSFRRQGTLQNLSWHFRINDSTPTIAHDNDVMYNREHQSRQIPNMACDEPMSSYNPGVRSEFHNHFRRNTLSKNSVSNSGLPTLTRWDTYQKRFLEVKKRVFWTKK